MNQKEKAKELFEKYRNVTAGIFYTKYEAKQCALIAVGEVLNVMPNKLSNDGYCSDFYDNPDIKFWKEVKQEIEKL